MMKFLLMFAAFLLMGSSDAFLLDTFQSIGNYLNNIKDAGVALVNAGLAKGKETIGVVVSQGLQGITNIADKTGLLQAFGKRNARRALWYDLATHTNQLEEHGHYIIQMFEKTMERLAKIVETLSQDLFDGSSTLVDVHNRIDSVVDNHTQMQDERYTLHGAFRRRSVFTDLGDFFALHTTALKDAVKEVGTTLKGHATDLWSDVKGSVKSLETKLSGQVDMLKE